MKIPFKNVRVIMYFHRYENSLNDTNNIDMSAKYHANTFGYYPSAICNRMDNTLC